MNARVLAAALLALVASGAALAAERIHHVVPGDSVSAIAMRYFGSPDRADLILRYNDREGTVIHPGETLRVPYAVVHRVRSGDAGSVLAQRYLGRPSAWPQVAELNGLEPRAPLAVGQAVTFPAVLPHVLERGESLAALAERHYGDPGLGRLLQAFNRIDDPRALAIGQTVEIPVLDLVLVDRPAAAPAHAPKITTASPVAERPKEPEAPPVVKTPPWFVPAIAEAERAFADGEFERADAALAALVEHAGDLEAVADRARLWRLAAFVHVAFERSEKACQAYATLRAADPEVAFDPVEVSPKIRESLARCAEEGSAVATL